MAKKKKKKPIKKMYEGRTPVPQQCEQVFKDKRKKRDKEWKKRVNPNESE